MCERARVVGRRDIWTQVDIVEGWWADERTAFKAGQSPSPPLWFTSVRLSDGSVANVSPTGPSQKTAQGAKGQRVGTCTRTRPAELSAG
jgi:hypothetical protein